MKKSKLGLLVLSAGSILSLASCQIQPLSNSSTFSNDDVGTIIKEDKQKSSVKELYEEAVENNEELENVEESTEENTEEVTPEEPSEEEEEEEEVTPEEPSEGEEEEEVTPEEPSEEEEEEVTPEEPSEEEEEEEVTISSYHVDYTYEFKLSASVDEHKIIDREENESYSLTYVNENDDLLLELSKSHSYKDGRLFQGEENIHAIYQDEMFYVDSSINNGPYYNETSKRAYSIYSHRLYKDFGDMFRYTYVDLLLGQDSLFDSSAMIEELLKQEDITVSEVDETTLGISYSCDGVDVTLVFDTELVYVKSLVYDASEALLNYYEIPEDSPIVIDEVVNKTTINFEYNNSSIERLSEEEIATYKVKKDHSHNNDHSYYGHGDDKKGNHHSSDSWDQNYNDHHYSHR